MQITHDDAYMLERIVRGVFNCDRGGMGGFIDADHFERAPFDAALIVLASLWEKDTHVDDEIADFLCKWEDVFRGNNNTNEPFSSYIEELNNIIKQMNH